MNAPIPILLYHAVGAVPDERMAPFTIERSRFAEHLDVLTDRGFQLCTVSELVAARDRGISAPLAAVTFDDGFASFVDDAWPELERRSIPATLYVTSGTVGASARWLDSIGCGSMRMVTWDDLSRLDGAGCEIGAHSIGHPPLDCIGRDAAQAEITGSRAALAERLDHPVDSFAYPHGHFDRSTRDAVVRAGFDSACAVRNAWSHRADDRYALARLTITADMTGDALSAALDGGVGFAPQRQLLRTRAYRFVRRYRHRRTAGRDALARRAVAPR